MGYETRTSMEFMEEDSQEVVARIDPEGNITIQTPEGWVSVDGDLLRSIVEAVDGEDE